MPTFIALYHFLTSIRLSVVLLLFLTADLCFGYICLHGNSSFFNPMNETGIVQWLITYGVNRPATSAWFFILLFLLFCLIINTLVCTFDKLYKLFTTFRARYANSKNFQLTLAIHLMHLAIVLLFVGYLISYTTSTIHHSITVVPDIQMNIPGSTVSFKLTKMEMRPYTQNRMKSFVGHYIDAQTHLLLRNGEKKKQAILSMNNPVFFQGYSFFLQRFNPRKKGGMGASQYVVIDIRRDHGIELTFAGMAAFILGLTTYILLYGQVRNHKGNRT
jgi:cytochrome c biogenesis protein ResB